MEDLRDEVKSLDMKALRAWWTWAESLEERRTVSRFFLVLSLAPSKDLSEQAGDAEKRQSHVGLGVLHCRQDVAKLCGEIFQNFLQCGLC